MTQDDFTPQNFETNFTPQNFETVLPGFDTIERFDLELKGQYESYQEMEPSQYGDWIRYDDVKKLLELSARRQGETK